MKLLLDECLPRRLKREFVGHEVFTVEEAGFKGLKNGNLIRSANADGFEILATVDKSIRHQQNKEKLSIAVLIFSAKSNRFESLSPLIPEALKILENIKIGEIITIE
jgi:predicted nuclease of predicted toxin-antitoxin system